MSPDEYAFLASIIMIGHNGRDYLRDSLRTILEQDMPAESYEVIYVDNASTDGSVELVEREFPAVRVIRMRTNLGFAAAFNRAAAEQARGRYLISTPQDVMMHRRWLSELIAAAESDVRVLKCVTNTVPPTSPDYARRALEGTPVTVTRTTMSRLGHVRVRTTPFDGGHRPTLASAGTSALMCREVAGRSGCYYDSTLAHYAVDWEAGLRTFVVGGITLHVPAAVVYHVGDERQSLRDPRRLLLYALGSRDAVLAFYKNMTAREFALFAPLLTLGLALKPLELRASLGVRLLLTLAALPLAPVAFAAALWRLDTVRPAHRDMLRRRRVGRYAVLKAIIAGRAVPPTVAAGDSPRPASEATRDSAA
jgi:hypothetical protein